MAASAEPEQLAAGEPSCSGACGGRGAGPGTAGRLRQHRGYRVAADRAETAAGTVIPGMAYAPVNGLQLYYEIRGSGSHWCCCMVA